MRTKKHGIEANSTSTGARAKLARRSEILLGGRRQFCEPDCVSEPSNLADPDILAESLWSEVE